MYKTTAGRLLSLTLLKLYSNTIVPYDMSYGTRIENNSSILYMSTVSLAQCSTPKL